VITRLSLLTVFVCAFATAALAQDPTGAIEGTVSDTTAARLAAPRCPFATWTRASPVRRPRRHQTAFYRLLLIPVGRYALTSEAPQFARLVQEPIK
jgi:hypothetical protein